MNHVWDTWENHFMALRKVGFVITMATTNTADHVRFEVYTVVTTKNAVFWDVNAVWLL
jgi:hypothetical protein